MADKMADHRTANSGARDIKRVYEIPVDIVEAIIDEVASDILTSVLRAIMQLNNIPEASLDFRFRSFCN